MPNTIKLYRIETRVDSATKAALRRLSRKSGKLIAELVRTYIVWGVEHDIR